MSALRPWSAPLLGLALSACGVPEEEFIEGYTTQRCRLELSCGDRALVFYEDLPSCKEVGRYNVASAKQGCEVYHPVAARRCVATLEDTTCADPVLPDESPCWEVYTEGECTWLGEAQR